MLATALTGMSCWATHLGTEECFLQLESSEPILQLPVGKNASGLRGQVIHM